MVSLISSPVSAEDMMSFISPVSFWTPLRTGMDSGWVEHAPFAFWLIEAMRPKCFVELGSYTGYSYSAVCQAVRALGTGTRCFAVDNWEGDDHAGFYSSHVFEDLSAYNDKNYAEFGTLLRSTFSEALSYFDDASIDLLHIDGRHAYEDVSTDFHEWAAKLTPDAVVMFHDTNVHSQGFGVARFWAEITKNRPHFEFLHGHGLGVLGSHAVTSPKMQVLFASSAQPGLQQVIRTAYGKLGFALRALYQDVRPERENLIADLKREKAAYSDGCDERDATIQSQMTRIADLERERAAFSDGCDERNVTIQSQVTRIADLEREKAAYFGGCKERDSIIFDLSDEKAHAQATLDGALDLIEELRQQRREWT